MHRDALAPGDKALDGGLREAGCSTWRSGPSMSSMPSTFTPSWGLFRKRLKERSSRPGFFSGSSSLNMRFMTCRAESLP